MPKLLVVDDESSIRLSIKAVFSHKDVTVLGAETAEEGIRLTLEQFPDVILLDIKLGPASGLDVFHELRRIDPRCLIIFITGYGTTDTAIEAMKLGAYDYLTKPLDAKQLKLVVEQALAISQLAHVPAIIDEGERPEDKPDRLIGGGAAMQTVCKQIGRVAPQDVNVLILGESGTGKELVARALYHHSRRSQAPLLAINCAAIPESLLESELFGHERGAFTGADRRRIGKFEQCHSGTLFLDEVGDMAPHTQAKILRLLQEGCFERVGGSESISVDIRIIAATNQDLDSLIKQDRFRKDLYYRLSGVTISLPALRDRRDDIAELAHYFLFRFNRQLGASLQSISPEALELLQAYPWPGNVRELQNVIRQAVIVSAGPTVLPEFLPADVQQDYASEAESDLASAALPDSDWQGLPQSIKTWIAGGEGDVYRRARELFDRLIIQEAMQHVGGNRSQAGGILGLSHVTLRAKLRSMESPREEVKPQEEIDQEPSRARNE
jgi:two-component system, NtrC family, nitrogen regulation response regulator GlnG